MNPLPIPIFSAKESAAAAKVLLRGGIGRDIETAAFEKDASSFMGLRHAAAVSSGTAALSLVLKALGAGPESEVIIPAYACAALPCAVRWIGATPVVADVHWHDGNISPAQIRRRMTHRTVAVVVLHSFGAPAEIEPILRLGIPVVEDLSQSIGAEDYNRRKLGTFGVAAMASLDSTHLISSAGEGGIVFSNDRRVIDFVRQMRRYGGKCGTFARWNVPMTDVQAAVARVQLKQLPSFLAARRKWALRYREALKGLALEFPLPLFGTAYHKFVVRSRRPVPEAFFSNARTRGLVTRPLEALPHWEEPGLGPFPVADRLWRRAVALPTHPALTELQFRRVVSHMKTLPHAPPSH